jgi:hypothetical protein
LWAPPTVHLPQCKTDNPHIVARAGDIYTLQLAAWLSVHPHKCYPISTLPSKKSVKMRASGTLASVTAALASGEHCNSYSTSTSYSASAQQAASHPVLLLHQEPCMTWPMSHIPSSVWTSSLISVSWWTAATTAYWTEPRWGHQCGMLNPVAWRDNHIKQASRS